MLFTNHRENLANLILDTIFPQLLFVHALRPFNIVVFIFVGIFVSESIHSKYKHKKKQNIHLLYNIYNLLIKGALNLFSILIIRWDRQNTQGWFKHFVLFFILFFSYGHRQIVHSVVFSFDLANILSSKNGIIFHEMISIQWILIYV